MAWKTMIRSTATIITLLSMVGSSLASSIDLEAYGSTRGSSVTGTILYVGGDGPGNYTKIQDAINDSHEGDIVYVYAASSPYHEHLEISKSITLIGENKATTEINASLLDNTLDTVNITGNHVMVSGFHITLNKGSYYQAAVKVAGSYATISECIIERNGWIGIYLKGAKQCEIRDCELFDNLVAVYLVGSKDNTVLNCSCHDNSDAITLFLSSNDNQIITSTCVNNGFDNIHIQQSSGNHIIGCVCKNGYDGISLAYTPGTYMHDNTMSNNIANFGIGSPDIDDFYCEIDTSNTINGKPMYYLVGERDRRFNGTTDVGFLGLVSCTNISVDNLTCSNNFEGMVLVNTSDSLIQHCRFQNNDGHGMYLIASSNNTVQSCLFQNSFFDGVFLYDATRNTLGNCSYSGSVDGVSLEGSQGNTIQGQIIQQCTVGIAFDTSSGNILKGNTMDHCGLKLLGHSPSDFINDADTSNMVNGRPLYYYLNETGVTVPSDAGQVILINGTGCIASGLNLSNASVGIELAYTHGTTITDNTFDGNSMVGIYLEYANSENTITDNVLADNNYGIDLVFSPTNLIQDNILLSNGLGVAVGASTSNQMVHNIIKDGAYGVYLEGSTFNTLTNNTVDNASTFGVYLASSNNNHVSENTMVDCSLLVYGTTLNDYYNDVDTTNTVQGKPVYYYLQKKNTLVPKDAGEVILVDCDDCTVRDLSLTKGSAGIILAYSSNNSIMRNTILQQSVTGIDLSSGTNNDNTIQGNILEGNSYAIDIEYSSRTTVKRNRIASNYDGIVLVQATGTTVRRNTISHNYYGISATETSESTVGLNNFYQNYLYGVYADASSLPARWNWWGTLTGPGGKGDHLGVVNDGRITYTPWKLFPVLLAGVNPSMRTQEDSHLGIPSMQTLSHNAASAFGLDACNDHHGVWDTKGTMGVHFPVFRNKAYETLSNLVQSLTETVDNKH